MNLRQGSTTGTVPRSQLGTLDVLIHGGTDDVRATMGTASEADLRHAIRHCAMNPTGNKTRRAALQAELNRRVADGGLEAERRAS